MFFLNEEMDFYNESVEPTNLGLDGFEGGLIAISESENMWHNLKEKMMKLEHRAIITEDQELLMEGMESFKANVTKIFNKMKQFVEEIYRRFVDWLTKMFGSDKQFVERFKGANGTVKIKAYDFSKVAGFEAKIQAAALSYTSVVDREDVSAEDVVTDLAKKLSLAGTVTDEAEFKVSLKETLRGTEVESLEVAGMLSIISSYKKDMENAKKGKEALQKTFNSLIKVFNAGNKKFQNAKAGDAQIDIDAVKKRSGETSYSLADSDEKYQKKHVTKKEKESTAKDTANAIATSKKASSLLIAAYSAFISALKERRTLARKVVYMSTKKEDEKQKPKAKAKLKESVDFEGILAEF